jgi:hypothetical protein
MESILDIAGAVASIFVGSAIVWGGWFLVTRFYVLRIPLAVVVITYIIFSLDQFREVLLLVYSAEGEIKLNSFNDVLQLAKQFWGAESVVSSISIVALASALAYWTVQFWLDHFGTGDFATELKRSDADFLHVVTDWLRKCSKPIAAGSFMASLYLAIVFYSFIAIAAPEQPTLLVAFGFWIVALATTAILGVLLALVIFASLFEDSKRSEWVSGVLGDFLSDLGKTVQGISTGTVVAFVPLSRVLLRLLGMPIILPLMAAPYGRRVVRWIGRVLHGTSDGAAASEAPVSSPQVSVPEIQAGVQRAPWASGALAGYISTTLADADLSARAPTALGQFYQPPDLDGTSGRAAAPATPVFSPPTLRPPETRTGLPLTGWTGGVLGEYVPTTRADPVLWARALITPAPKPGLLHRLPPTPPRAAHEQSKLPRFPVATFGQDWQRPIVSSSPTMIDILSSTVGSLPLVLVVISSASFEKIAISYALLLLAIFGFIVGGIGVSVLMILTTFLAGSLFILVPIWTIACDCNLSGQIGSIAITNAFLTAALGLFCILREVSVRTGFPALIVLVGVGLGLAWFDLDDNHRIRGLASTPQPQSAMDAQFKAWYDARQDRDDFKTGEYPVYIVAARGGGIYAAYHAAYFLAAAQDYNSAFAHHVFALSSVSGGSLGAAVFNASVFEHPPTVPSEQDTVPPEQEEWFRMRVRQVLSQDLLSQVTAATLFSDVPARLLPCSELPVLGTFCPGRKLDRARALERAFENAWAKDADAAAANRFSQSVYSAWDARLDAPALLINSTEVETGERVVVAPFALNGATSSYPSTIRDRAPSLDIALSTAVVLSARFPGLTPAGTYVTTHEGKAEKRRLVDGGYFENSGVATAFDMINHLSTSPTAPKVRFILIALVGDASEEMTDTADHTFGELMSPLRTLETTRSARGRVFVEQAAQALNGKACPDFDGKQFVTCKYDGPMRQAVLAPPKDVVLPLGWLLSRRSREAIEASVAGPSECAAAGIPPPVPISLQAQRSNGCLIAQIGDDLASSRKSRK